MIAVILAGGSGTRFWPLSRENHPKQLLKLTGDDTLLQSTYRRLQKTVSPNDIYVVAQEATALVTCQQLRTFGFQPDHLIAEPCGRNTAAAVALAARYFAGRGEEVMGIFPADHLIRDEENFIQSIHCAGEMAAHGGLVTLGALPTRPETGFGYIQSGEALPDHAGFRVRRFVEKPDAARARTFLEEGTYYWNMGMFLFKVSSMQGELDRWLPDLSRELAGIRAHLHPAGGPHGYLEFDAAGRRVFAALESVSIDYGVLEKSGNVLVAPCDFDWSDVGAWNALESLWGGDDAGNVLVGDVVALDAADNIIHGRDRLIAALGVDGLIIVDTPDALLVCRKDRAQDIRKLVEQMRKLGREEVRTSPTVQKPWGSYTVYARPVGCLIKSIEVLPGQKLSLQSHQFREEHWVVVAGKAEVELAGKRFLLGVNESTFIPRGAKHRLGNPGRAPLVLIEIQTGETLREDDITRFEDSYGRAEAPDPS
ncbi:MAG: mannose-1-phosphate guanylyltransferase/mannose-6-phosphate isomerase [Nitrospinaceae bacterium]